MRRKDTLGLMKIGEVARAANTSISTVKYYVSQGLVEAAFKTSANMAYYHPSCVERINLIKKLQKEKFYPLSLIKKLLEQNNRTGAEIELMDAIHKVPPAGASASIPISSAPAETGLTKKQMDELLRRRIIYTATIDQKKVFTDSNVKIMRLVKQRMDGGMPFEQTAVSFGAYGDELGKAADADVDAVIAKTLLTGEYSTRDMVKLIRLSDETLDEFIKLKRDQLNRYYGSRRMEDLTRFLDNISDFLFSCLIPAMGRLQGASSFILICGLMDRGDFRAASEASLKELDPQFAWAFQTLVLLRKNGNEENSARPIGQEHDFVLAVEKLNSLFRLVRKAGLASVIPTVRQCRDFFMALKPKKNGEACCRLFLYYMRLAFLYLAPPVLGCGEQARTALDNAFNYTLSCIKDREFASIFTNKIHHYLNREGGRL